jgi:hypothetical protein
VCRKEDCPKNHIEHITMSLPGGKSIPKAIFHLVHHKEQKHGPIDSPMSSALVGVVTLLEKASHFLAPDCHTLFFNHHLESCSPQVFQKVRTWGSVAMHVHVCITNQAPTLTPMMQMASKALSFGSTHITPTAMRHETATKLRDFGASDEGIKELLGTHLETAVAHMMGNTPASWDAAYDDHKLGRDQEKVGGLGLTLPLPPCTIFLAATCLPCFPCTTH